MIFLRRLLYHIPVVFLWHVPLAACFSLKVRFTYKSYMNDVSVWFTMFTLCLAPLVSHIALGLPKIVVMDSSEESADTNLPSKLLYPPWTERITLFNPVTIVWRYYAIAYFRLRNRSWDATELAAVNAAFWDSTTRRWDGTDTTVLSARKYLTSPPEASHVKIISGSTLATVLLVLQGVQALLYMISYLSTSSAPKLLPFPDGLPYLFVPIGLLGLVRLPAAAWVSNEWGYDFTNLGIRKICMESLQFRNKAPNRTFRIMRKPVPGQYIACKMRGLPDTEHGIVSTRLTERRQKLLHIGNWKCYAYRGWWIVSNITISALGVRDVATSFVPSHSHRPLSASMIIYLMLYLELCGGFLLITPVLVLRRNHTSTLIPCLQNWWYKLYTWLIVLTALAALVFASLETVQLPDGTYMSTELVTCHWDQCRVWNKTSLLEGVRKEWERYLNISHIDASSITD